MPLCLFLAVTLRRGNNQGARSRDGGGGGTVSEVELAARGRRRRLSQSPWRRKHTALPSRSVRPSRVSLRRPSSTKSPCHSYGDPDTASTSQATICRGGGCGVDGCWYRLGDAGGRHVSLEDTLGLHRWRRVHARPQPDQSAACHGSVTGLTHSGFRVRGDRPDFEVRDTSQSVRTGRGRLTQHLPADRPLLDVSLPFDLSFGGRSTGETGVVQ